MKNKRIVAIALLLFAAALIGGIWLLRARSSDGVISSVSTASVVRRDFTGTVLATGAVRPQVGAEVRVGSRISGRVESLLSNIGDAVERGQVIAELEKEDLKAKVERDKADLRAAKVRRILAEKVLKRHLSAIDTNAVSQHAVDEAQKENDLAEARIGQALASLRLAEVELSYSTILAPISGVVASVSTQEGETVAAGLNAPTFLTIIDLGRLQVDAYVDEVDIGKVTVGQRAFFTVDAFPAREFEGEVVAIHPKAVIQENVVNYDVEIDISSPYEGLLRPEMTASVTIVLEVRREVLAVPARAVKRERGKSIVYVIVDEQPQAREVKTGWKDGQWIEIAAGLEDGQSVLLETPALGREEK